MPGIEIMVGGMWNCIGRRLLWSMRLSTLLRSEESSRGLS